LTQIIAQIGDPTSIAKAITTTTKAIVLPFRYTALDHIGHPTYTLNVMDNPEPVICAIKEIDSWVNFASKSGEFNQHP
jgi:hypothetical protein